MSCGLEAPEIDNGAVVQRALILLIRLSVTAISAPLLLLPPSWFLAAGFTLHAMVQLRFIGAVSLFVLLVCQTAVRGLGTCHPRLIGKVLIGVYGAGALAFVQAASAAWAPEWPQLPNLLLLTMLSAVIGAMVYVFRIAFRSPPSGSRDLRGNSQSRELRNGGSAECTCRAL
jgi:hypothetical protein